MPANVLRNLPSVSELLENPRLKSLIEKVNRNTVVAKARSLLDDLRHEVQTAATEIIVPGVTELAEKIAQHILQGEHPALRPVVNATGVILDSSLGRAPLAEEALAAMLAAARDYVSLELDLETGKPSARVLAVEKLLLELTGAEAALVVNNNAGATLLALGALAAGGEVIVSRGQLIEIGSSYRLADVMAASNAVLREVGATNMTRLADYSGAINPQTAVLLLVHTSNFKVSGSTAEVSLAELVKLGHERQLPLIHDLGAGALVDFEQFGCVGEPVVSKSIEQGADLVLFSGDKLLGGPQCGIIVGKRALIEQLSRHPLARALQVDKITLAALAATLRLYRDPATARRSIPLVQLLSTSAENLKCRAERLAPQLAQLPALASAEAVQETTYLGSDSLPMQELPTWCIAMTPAKGSVDRLATKLRSGVPSVVGRVQNDRLLFDLRSVFPRQDQQLVAAVAALEEAAT
jgi:L-seryl-tRNA(Ser) seleniumtransferase